MTCGKRSRVNVLGSGEARVESTEEQGRVTNGEVWLGGPLRRLHEAYQVVEAREDVVRWDALAQKCVPRDAAREDGDEPHPSAAGGVDIREPIPNVDGMLAWDRNRGKNGVQGPGVRLRVPVLPRAGRRKPSRI